MALTYSHQLDQRDSEVVLVSHLCVHALIVNAGQGEAEQSQKRRDGEAEIDL